MKLTRWISKFERYLDHADTIPAGWGYCRPSVYCEFKCLIAPIPLNFAIGLFHWFYWQILVRGFHWLPGGYETLRQHWIEVGWSRGQSEGYELGVRHTTAALTKKSGDPDANW